MKMDIRKYANAIKEIILSIYNGDFSVFLNTCPNCGKKTVFVKYGKYPLQVRCLKCHRTHISLAILHVIKEIKLDKESTVYELSYHGPVYEYFKKHFVNFYFSEYYPDSPDKYVNGVLNEDIQSLTFEDCKFNIISSTEVFEHVADYMKGFKEVYRVLKSDGFFVFTVPLFDQACTEQICRLDKNGDLIWLGKEEYHGSRVSGVNSVPVFWKHSRNQVTRDLLSVGFREAMIAEHYLDKNRSLQCVIICRK
jgi:ribosomal protein S27AE